MILFWVGWSSSRNPRAPLPSGRMKVLAFSDVHRDLERCAELAERSASADIVIGAGDFASVHRGLEETIAVLRGIDTPTLLVPGNNETDDALRAACEGWEAATVLHGEAATLDGIEFFGLGAGIPVTPWDWSFDLSEEEAEATLEPAPAGGVFILHSPPRGKVDVTEGGEHLGSEAILNVIEAKEPSLAVCGHVHDSWGAEDRIGPTRVLNLGPQGIELEL
jgi:uncharacterized protein